MREPVIIVNRDAIDSGRRLQQRVRYVALYKAPLAYRSGVLWNSGIFFFFPLDFFGLDLG